MDTIESSFDEVQYVRFQKDSLTHIVPNRERKKEKRETSPERYTSQKALCITLKIHVRVEHEGCVIIIMTNKREFLLYSSPRKTYLARLENESGRVFALERGDVVERVRERTAGAQPERRRQQPALSHRKRPLRRPHVRAPGPQPSQERFGNDLETCYGTVRVTVRVYSSSRSSKKATTRQRPLSNSTEISQIDEKTAVGRRRFQRRRERLTKAGRARSWERKRESEKERSGSTTRGYACVCVVCVFSQTKKHKTKNKTKILLTRSERAARPARIPARESSHTKKW